jgi:hypothetical protein
MIGYNFLNAAHKLYTRKPFKMAGGHFKFAMKLTFDFSIGRGSCDTSDLVGISQEK